MMEIMGGSHSNKGGLVNFKKFQKSIFFRVCQMYFQDFQKNIFGNNFFKIQNFGLKF